MKSFKEYDQEKLLEEQIDDILITEGRLGAAIKSAAAILRAKQSAYKNRVMAEKDTAKKMNLISEQVASLSTLVLVILGAIAKDARQIKSAGRR